MKNFLIALLFAIPTLLTAQVKEHYLSYFGTELVVPFDSFTTRPGFAVIQEIERKDLIFGFKTSVNDVYPTFAFRMGVKVGEPNFHVIFFLPILDYNFKENQYYTPLTIETRLYKRSWMAYWTVEYYKKYPRVRIGALYNFKFPK